MTHICSYLAGHALRLPDKALALCQGKAKTFRTMHSEVAALSQALRTALGVIPGDRIGLIAKGTDDFLQASCGLEGCPQYGLMSSNVLHGSSPTERVRQATLMLGMNSPAECYHNKRHTMQVFLAVTACGALAVPINLRWSIEETAAALQSAAAELLFVDADLVQKYRSVLAERRCIVVSAGEGTGVAAFTGSLQSNSRQAFWRHLCTVNSTHHAREGLEGCEMLLQAAQRTGHDSRAHGCTPEPGDI